MLFPFLHCSNMCSSSFPSSYDKALQYSTTLHVQCHNMYQVFPLLIFTYQRLIYLENGDAIKKFGFEYFLSVEVVLREVKERPSLGRTWNGCNFHHCCRDALPLLYLPSEAFVTGSLSLYSSFWTNRKKLCSAAIV